MSTAVQVSMNPAIAPALPSASSALALVNGQPGALPIVIAHTALRAGIIGIGLLVAGQRQGVVKNSLVASVAIETFVLLWATHQKNQAAKLAGT